MDKHKHLGKKNILALVDITAIFLKNGLFVIKNYQSCAKNSSFLLIA